MLKKLALVLVVILAIAFFLIARDWDSPEMGQALLDQAGDATGMKMTATGFRLNLLRGLVLENVEVSSQSEGRELDVTLDQLVFEHRLAPLLSGTVAIDRIVLERPQIELVEPATGASEPSPATEGEPGEPTGSEGETAVSEKGGLALEVQQILISDATVVMRKKGEDGETRIEGLDFLMEDLNFDPRAHSLAALGAEGQLDVQRVVLDNLEVSDTHGRFQLADARFEMPTLTFATKHGQFGANMEVDFNPVPFTYTLSAQGDPLDLNGIMGAREGFGPARTELDAKGVGSETKDIKASGGFQLAEGEFPAAAAIAGIDEALGKKLIVGATYEATEANYRLANNTVTLDPFRFQSGDARLDLAGTVSLEGPVNLNLSVSTAREGLNINGVGGDVLDLLADDEGWVPVPITITGTLENPKVRPDAKALLDQAAQGAKREVTERATDALRGLLKKKKN